MLPLAHQELEVPQLSSIGRPRVVALAVLLIFVILGVLAFKPSLEDPLDRTAPRLPTSAIDGYGGVAEPRPLTSFEVSGQWGGTIGDLAIDGTTAYLGTGPRLVAWDLADPSRPRRLGASEPLEGPIEQVLVHRGMALVLGEFGLRAIDVGDPTRPRVVGQRTFQWTPRDMAVDEAHLYVLESDATIHVLNIGPDGAIEALGLPREAPNENGIVATDGFLFSFGGEVSIFDSSNPGTLVKVADLNMVDWDGTRDFLVQGSTAIAVEEGYEGSGIRVFDIGTPSAPQELGHAMVDGVALWTVLVGDTLVVASVDSGDEGLLHAIDLREPTAPRLMNSARLEQLPRGLAASGNRLYVVSGETSVEVFDVRDGMGLMVVGELIGENAVPAGVLDVAVDGDFAYLSSPNLGLSIVDLSSPAAPRLRGRLEKNPLASMVEASGGFAFLSTGRGLGVVDVTQPDDPRIIGHLDIRGDGIYPAVMNDGLLLIAAPGEDRLLTVDVSDPANPRQLGSLGLPSPASLTVSDGIAYVTDTTGGLWLVDVSDPKKLRVLDKASTVSCARDVAAKDGLAFIACGEAGLWITDLSDPSRPRHLATVDLGGDPFRVVLGGDTLFVTTSGDQGLYRVHALDLSDPLQPRRHGGLATVGSSALAMLGRYVVVGLRDERQQVLQVAELTTARLPRPAGEFEPGRSPQAVTAYGRWLLVGTASGLYLVDSSDLAAEHQVAALAEAEIFGVEVACGLAYVRTHEGLTILDLDTPLAPKVLTTIPVKRRHGTYREFTVDGRLLYLISNERLEIWDLIEPARPQKLGGTSLAASEDEPDIGGIALANGHAFVPVDQGLLVFDVSNPSALHMVGTLGFGDLDADAIAIDGDLAYITTGGPAGQTVLRVDIRDPEWPHYLAADSPLDRRARDTSVAVHMGRVFLINSAGEVDVLSPTGPGLPFDLGHIPLPGDAVDMAFQGNRLLVAAGSGGLHVVAIPETAPTRDR